MYDTGGLSLKVGGHMAGMKCDMGGAAGVVGATLALAEGGFRHGVVCAAGLVENAIGPTAYRPDDILDMHSGHTVEVNNTDAEGRLVLADAASYIGREYDVEVIIDMATLTGAQLIATGHRHAGIVSNRGGLEAAAVAAGLASGDMTFPMPFAPEFYQHEFRSKVADMKNSVADRMNAQSACAAQFVYSHIDDLDIPWLHVDIAGPAFRDERGTGFGVALVACSSCTSLKKADLAAVVKTRWPMPSDPTTPTALDRLVRDGSDADVRRFLLLLQPPEVADLLEALENRPEDRNRVFQAIVGREKSEVLADMDDGAAADILEDLPVEEAAELIGGMHSDDAVDVLQEMDEDKQEQVLEQIEPEDREELREILTYPEDSAGGIMQIELVAANAADWTAQQRRSRRFAARGTRSASSTRSSWSTTTNTGLVGWLTERADPRRRRHAACTRSRSRSRSRPT